MAGHDVEKLTHTNLKIRTHHRFFRNGAANALIPPRQERVDASGSERPGGEKLVMFANLSPPASLGYGLPLGRPPLAGTDEERMSSRAIQSKRSCVSRSAKQ